MEDIINFLETYNTWLVSPNQNEIELPNMEDVQKMSLSLQKLDELIKNTDWTLFSEQKTSLVKAADYFDKEVPEQQEHFNGLLNFIDGLQDCFADNLGYEEKYIFPNLED